MRNTQRSPNLDTYRFTVRPLGRADGAGRWQICSTRKPVSELANRRTGLKCRNQ
jgi:hypothetical protein